VSCTEGFNVTTLSLVMPGLDPGIHSSSHHSCEKMDHRFKPGDDIQFGSRLLDLLENQTDLPDRHCVDSPVQPFPKKYSASSPGRNTFKPHAIPPSQEGRIAIVTDVGCGMRWTRRCHKTNDTAADGEAVWS
jgi:hypothetical protein